MRGLDRTITPLLGRLMIAAIFIWSGYGKIVGPEGAIGYIEHAGLPQPQYAYWVAVAVEFGGGLLLVVGLLTRFVAVILALFCLVTGYWFHLQAAQSLQGMDAYLQWIHAYKNLAMAGGLLYVAAHGAGLISVDATFTHGRRTADD